MIFSRNMSSRKSLNCDRHLASKIEAQISIFHMVFKKLIISEQIIGLFCELSRQFIHSPIIIATTEPPSRIARRVFPVLSCSTYCGRTAPSIVQRRHRTNRPDPRAPRSGFNAPRWMTARKKWRQWQPPIPRSPSGQHQMERHDPRRLRARRSDGDFCPSPRDDGNRALNEDLAVMKCRMSKENSVAM
jgi:hypothetical protein